ncbi:MAG: hypothetical protein ACJ74U_03340 [Jatrophihabitantaceae bacterium]
MADRADQGVRSQLRVERIVQYRGHRLVHDGVNPVPVAVGGLGHALSAGIISPYLTPHQARLRRSAKSDRPAAVAST